MLSLFPDHQKGLIYDLPTEAQLERAYQLAKTPDGRSYDDLIAEGDIVEYAKYFARNSKQALVSVVEKQPMYIDGQPIYLQGNVYDLAKDKWNGTSTPPGGINPLVNNGSASILRGSGWTESYGNPQPLGNTSDFRLAFNPNNRFADVGIRIVTTEGDAILPLDVDSISSGFDY